MCCVVSQCLAILDEAGALGDPVVEFSSRGVGFVRHPIETASAIFAGEVGHCVDQSRACSEAALGVVDIEILKIAGPLRKPAGTMKDGVDDAGKTILAIESAECIHLLRGVMEAVPGELG